MAFAGHVFRKYSAVTLLHGEKAEGTIGQMLIDEKKGKITG